MTVVGRFVFVAALGVTGCSSGITVTVSSTSPTTAPATQTTVKEVTSVPAATTVPPACLSGYHHSATTGVCVPDATTTVATTAPPEKGSRTNPFSIVNSSLSLGTDWNPIAFEAVEDVSPSLVHKANQFNDDAPAGQKYVRFHVEATYVGSDKGTGSSLDTALNLVGDKGKIYESPFLSDSHNVLLALTDQPDVIDGGKVSGFIYRLVDADDANLLIILDASSGTQFIDITPF